MSEQFEDSIRKKLQEADIPFEPAAWDQMTKRLDDSGRRRPFFWWWAGGLIFLLGVGGWWFYQQQVGDKAEQQSRIPVTENAAGQQTTGEGKPGYITPAPGATSADPQTEKKPDGEGNTSVAATPGKTGVDKPAANNVPVAERDSSIVPNDADEDKPTHVSATQPPAIPPAANTAGVDKPAALAAPNANPTLADSSLNEAPRRLPLKNKPVKRRFDAGITLGPDYNTIPSLQYGRIGFGGGLLLRYHINSSFYLSTGAAYTKKLYGANDKDYYSPYPTNYKKIDADCNVLDVPLNIHYTFLHRPKHSWSAMVGASSYFMLKEKYDYYTNSGGKYTREYNNSNQHYFSVLNVGVNYERQTGGRIKWGLQPYLKLPLGGVGQGKVNLYSAGVSLQVTVGKKD
jgi:hypothetical protein